MENDMGLMIGTPDYKLNILLQRWLLELILLNGNYSYVRFPFSFSFVFVCFALPIHSLDFPLDAILSKGMQVPLKTRLMSRWRLGIHYR